MSATCDQAAAISASRSATAAEALLQSFYGDRRHHHLAWRLPRGAAHQRSSRKRLHRLRADSAFTRAGRPSIRPTSSTSGKNERSTNPRCPRLRQLCRADRPQSAARSRLIGVDPAKSKTATFKPKASSCRLGRLTAQMLQRNGHSPIPRARRHHPHRDPSRCRRTDTSTACQQGRRSTSPGPRRSNRKVSDKPGRMARTPLKGQKRHLDKPFNTGASSPIGASSAV